MSDLERIPLDWQPDEGEQPGLFLWRKRNEGERRPILLVHGLSARHETFEIPAPSLESDGKARCLLDWLHQRGWEPWVLDWRGSGLVLDEMSDADLARLHEKFDFDHVARFDIPAALRTIADHGVPCRHAFGHCMGAASLAYALARSHETLGPGLGLSHVVLCTIGLFYRPAWDGRLKSLSYILEELRSTQAEHTVIDPRPGQAWPDRLEDIYASWPRSLRMHREESASPVNEMCNRLSFMYGPPYLESQLAEGVHDEILRQFGALALKIYLHVAQNIRRGWAADFAAGDDDDRLLGKESEDGFRALEKITLLTGAKNQIWHRDSIDRMYEWLRRRNSIASLDVHKHILPDYAHQDLLWGRHAWRDVFPRIGEGLS